MNALVNASTSALVSVASQNIRAVAYEISDEGRQAAVNLADRLTDYVLFVPQLALRYTFLVVLGLAALFVFGLLVTAYSLLVVATVTMKSILKEMDAEPGDEPFGALMEEIRSVASSTAYSVSERAIEPCIVLDMTPIIYPAQEVLASEHRPVRVDSPLKPILLQKLVDETIAIEKEIVEELSEAEAISEAMPEVAPQVVAPQVLPELTLVKPKRSKKSTAKAAAKPAKSSAYSASQMEAAVADVLGGLSSVAAATKHGVPASTLRKHAAKRK